MRSVRVGELRGGDEVASVCELRRRMGRPDCVPTCVIEMKMSVYDDRDVLRSRTGLLKQCFSKRPVAEDTVHLLLFVIPLLTDTGLDKYPLFTGVDEHAIQDRKSVV